MRSERLFSVVECFRISLQSKSKNIFVLKRSMLISVFATGNKSLCKFIVDLVLVQKMYRRENFSFKMLLTTCAADLPENVKGALQTSILWLYLLIRNLRCIQLHFAPCNKFEFNHAKALKTQ